MTEKIPVVLQRLLAGLLITTFAGCSGLEARRVPLKQRLCGCDDQTEGFRYYLSRPHIVVSKRVEVATTTQIGELFKSPFEEEFAVRTVDHHGQNAYFDLAGNELVATPDLESWSPFEVKQASRQPSIDGSLQLASFQERSMSNLPSRNDSLAPTTRDDESSTPAPVEQPDSAVEDCMKVVFLPDFEEQMAVRHRNCLGQSELSLNFRNGWQLKSVTGNFDSTEVPIQILKTVQNAISGASTVEQERIKQRLAASGAGAENVEKIDRNVTPQRVIITRAHYIDPGMYRLNKASEMHPGAEMGMGILTDMGIPVTVETKVRIVGAEIQEAQESVAPVEKEDDDKEEETEPPSVSPMTNPLAPAPDSGTPSNGTEMKFKLQFDGNGTIAPVEKPAAPSMPAAEPGTEQPTNGASRRYDRRAQAPTKYHRAIPSPFLPDDTK